MKITQEEMPASVIGPRLTERSELWRRFVGTFLSFPCLFDRVVHDSDFDRLMSGATRRDWRYFVRRVLEKSLWFWPRIIDAGIWVRGASGERIGPDHYTEFDLSSRVLCDAVVRYSPTRDAPVLDLGCNVGRHLNNLRENGFTNLHGVDAMGAAFERMAEVFPQTRAQARLTNDLFQRFLRNQTDRAYHIIYTHGATIELVHPSFDVVGHLCRVAERHVILMHNELNEHAYPRFWYYEFARNGFYLAEARRPAVPLDPINLVNMPSLLVFSRFPARDGHAHA